LLPIVAAAIGVVGLVLFAAALLGVIQPLSHPPAAVPQSDSVLTGIHVTYFYTNVGPVFGPNLTQACPECPMDLLTGSVVEFSYSLLNTTGLTKALVVNVSLSSTAPVFLYGGVRSSIYNYSEELAPGRVFPAGLSLYSPATGGISFSISSVIQVGYCGSSECPSD
jgi:hypothetical protein